ncbi:MAG: hypothetical protein AABX33_00770 [Nanoarchaeota archaeon]
MRILAITLFIVFSLMSNVFGQQPSCDYQVEILVDSNEFEKEEFKWRMRASKLEGKSTNITATAKIEDSHGKTVKSYKPWTSDAISKQKTSSEYSPNLKAGEEYKISAEIAVECDDNNKENNADIKKISIKGEEIKSEKINKDSLKKVTKEQQDENNQLIQKTQTSVEPKPQITIDNRQAENVVELKSKESKETKEINSMAVSAVKSPEIVYLSSSEKSKGLVMILLLTLSILLNIVLIWKR